MYLWKMKLLKKQLSDHGLTEKQLFSYIFIYIALSAIGIEAMGYIPHQPSNAWTYVGSIINVMIPIFGTIWIFRANGGESGTHFSARYFSIGLVATIRFMVLLVPLLAVLVIYWVFSHDLESDIPTTGIEIALFTIWYAMLYVYIAKHVREVANA
ncbi:MAG: hypothetical protein A3I66_00280 [Burkholderiales bacterium RIFCSPLOWO2_02_FULL_57_36]|nr:MAG: hypothetical protein A3I66_00280 [Burkholderiales bacterium RIFCSPLOWO2_02_FULL_57_36]